LLIIPVPGHTKGHTVLLYQNKFLFTGDHLAWSDQLNSYLPSATSAGTLGQNNCNPMRQLANYYSFEWVLPGMDAVIMQIETMRHQMQQCMVDGNSWH